MGPGGLLRVLGTSLRVRLAVSLPSFLGGTSVYRLSVLLRLRGLVRSETSTSVVI